MVIRVPAIQNSYTLLGILIFYIYFVDLNSLILNHLKITIKDHYKGSLLRGYEILIILNLLKSYIRTQKIEFWIWVWFGFETQYPYR
jgi:hypothetical protein